MSVRMKTSVCLFLLVIGLSLIRVMAQDITGSIVGVVRDQNGAAVVGATVTIKDTDKNIVVRTIKTDSYGAYSAPLLRVGHYSVTIEAPGFKQFTQTGIELNVNDRLTVDAALQVGGASEVVTVQASPIQVELQSATAAGLISDIEVRELPLNNRNYEQLVTLMPGVSSGMADQIYIGVTNPTSGAVNIVSVAINGGRNSQNSWTVDGADNVDRGSNLTLLNYPSVDAIAEFKVLRNHYSAEFGRNASGHVNVITKSGTSHFHGDAYEFFRNDKLNANNFFNNLAGRFTTDPNAKPPDTIVPPGDPRAGKEKAPRPPLRYNNFGYTFGGPVYIPGVYNKNKDKTFFFWSQEFRRVITYSTFTATVPTELERQGIFSQPVCVVATGNTCTQTATSITNINPVAAAYIKDIYSRMPLPNLGGNNLLVNARNVFNHRQDLIRIDHHFSSKYTVFVRYLNDSIPTEEPFGLFGPNSLLPGVATSRTNSPGHSWVVRGVQTFNPRLLNEAGYSFSYGAIISRLIGLVNPDNSPDVAAAVKLPFTPTLRRIPSISPGFSGVSGFGPYDDFNRNHNIYDNLTWIKGTHTLKFGTSINFYQKTENAAGNNAGSFSFASTPRPSTTPAFLQQWANFLLGNVSSFTQASQDFTPDVRSKQIEFYVQDDFRVKPNLTLNMGVRYSLFRQPYDAKNQLTNFYPPAFDPSKAFQMDPVTGNRILGTGDPLNGIIQAGKNSPFGSKVAPENYRAIAPVFGFAWDPFGNGRTAIRGGYGMSYDLILTGIYEQNIFTNPPLVSTITINNTRLENPAAVLPNISAAPVSLRGTPIEGDIPYIQQWSLDVQREIMKNFIIAVGYYGSKGTHLPGIVDFNLVPPGAAIAAGIIKPGDHITTATTPRLNIIRPFRGYNAINTIQNWFNSNYNSMQVAIEKRFSGGSLIKASYTWSHNLTDNQTDRSTAPQDFYNRALDYGPASLDRRQILTVNYVYAIPFMRNKKGMLGQILGGWQLSGITYYAAGAPLTVTYASGTADDPAALGFLGPSASGPRPDVLINPMRNAPKTRIAWFDTTAFADVPIGVNRAGNSPRGVVRGPGYGRWDVALGKYFRIREGMRLQFRAEAFNVFNHTNFSGVNTAFKSAAFGQVTSTRDPRIMQLAMKFYF
jgi:hypothetical protein